MGRLEKKWIVELQYGDFFAEESTKITRVVPNDFPTDALAVVLANVPGRDDLGPLWTIKVTPYLGSYADAL